MLGLIALCFIALSLTALARAREVLVEAEAGDLKWSPLTAWSRGSDARYSGGEVMHANEAGVTMIFTFRGAHFPFSVAVPARHTAQALTLAY